MRNTDEYNGRTIYDVESITAYAKRRLRTIIISLSLYTLLLAASVIAIILYGSYLAVFIIAVTLICISTLMLGRTIKIIKLQDYTYVLGDIANVHKEIKTVRTTLGGGINLFGPRKYDKYNKEQVRLEICIRSEGEIHGYFMTETNEEHAAYYEAAYGEAMHIWGTRFPVRINTDEEAWLCPICGEFNSRDTKHCTSCGIKAIK